MAAVHEFEIKGFHIAGVDNREADLLSRCHLDASYSRQFMENAGSDWTERFADDSLFSFSHNW